MRRPTFEVTRAALDAWAKRKLSGVALTEELGVVMPECDDWKTETMADAAAGKCEGNCEQHRGKVQAVHVAKWGYFAYCEAAIAEDERRGLTVRAIDT